MASVRDRLNAAKRKEETKIWGSPKASSGVAARIIRAKQEEERKIAQTHDKYAASKDNSLAHQAAKDKAAAEKAAAENRWNMDSGRADFSGDRGGTSTGKGFGELDRVNEPTFIERVASTAAGAGKQYAANLGSALTGLYSLGAHTRETEAEKERADIERRLKLMEQGWKQQLAAGTVTEQEQAEYEQAVKAQQDKLNIIKTTQRAWAGTSGASLGAMEQLEHSAQRDIEKAKEGLGGVGKFVVDTGVAGSQMLMDAALGGGSAMIPMAGRVFGGGYQEATQEGATNGQALAYGAGSAAVSVLTEKLASVAAPFKKIYGGGWLDDAITKATGKLGASVPGRLALSALSEAGEEFLEAVAQPVLQRATYDKDAQFDLSEALYSALIGATLGGFGSGVELIGNDLTPSVSADGADGSPARGEPSVRTTEDPKPVEIEQVKQDTPIQKDTDSILYEMAREMTQKPQKTNFEQVGTDTARAQIVAEGTEQARSTTQREYNIRRMQEVATTLGENGAKTLNTIYDGKTRTDSFFGGFAAYYEAGVSGQDMGKVRNKYGTQLNEAQKFAAYTAGQNDAAASLAAEKRAAQFAQVAGESSGLVYDDYVRGTMDSAVADRVNSVAKLLGTRVRFVDSVRDGTANAQITGSEVLVEKNNPNPVMFLLGHEWTHRMQELAPEQYRAFREAVAEEVQGEAKVLLVQYRAQGESITYEAALDEAAANYAGRMIEDGKVLDNFIEKHKNDRTMLEKVREAIRNLVRKLTGAEKRLAQTAEGKLAAALETASQQAGKLSAQNDTSRGTMEAERYSLKEDLENGRTRKESREDFKRRCNAEGYSVHEGKTAAYGFRRPVAGAARENARQVQKESIQLGIDAVIIEGPLLKNRDGVTSSNAVQQARTATGVCVFINNEVTLPARNVAGHEAFHLWKSGVGRDAYVETVEDNLLFTSEEFREYQSAIAEAHLGDEADLSDPKQEAILTEELFAYISGDIHEGVYDEYLRPMFRDFEAVKAAWNELVELNGEKARSSLKGSEKLTWEIDRIMKDGRKAGRSDADIRADIEAAVEQAYQDMVEQYGAIKPGEKPSRYVTVPRRTAKDKKVSQTVRTILEAKVTPDAAVPSIEQLTAQGDFSYEVITDKEAMSGAGNKITSKGYKTALADWVADVKDGKVSKANTAMGWALYNAAANEGDLQTAMTILNYMVQHQRNAAQAVQATRILKKLSPDAQLYGVQRSVESMKEELEEKYGDKVPDIKVNEELAQKFLEASTEKEREKAMQDLYRDIGRQMPSRFVDKWNAWRYLAMLGNPRTHVRNVVGNAFFAPVVATKNLTATAIESAVDFVAPNKISRTKGALDRKLLAAAWGDYTNAADQIAAGGKYSETAAKNQYIQEGRIIFKNKALEKARKANSGALELEDMWFARPHYAAALAQYCKANGITETQLRSGKGLARAREYAVREAQKATYRDTNAFSQAISELGRYTGKNPVKKGVGMVLEGILPFRKTPANILVRGLEYSPAGLLKSLTYDLAQVKRGNKTAAEAIDGISAGLTGTGLLALGVFLASQGLVRGSGGDDDKKNFEELQGHQAYALELSNGTSVTLDWLAPEVLPFFVGVNLYEQSLATDAGLTMSDILTATANVTEPLLEMSCLQSLNDVFDSVGYASSEGLSALPSALVSATTSYLTQGFPTLLGQVERTGEDTRMTTYTEKNAFLTTDMQYTIGRISARLPSVDFQQIPYIDAWGRTENTGTAGERAFNNFANPAYMSTVETSPMEDELLRLYEATEDSSVLPSRARKYYNVDKERKDLTAEEYVKYATVKGQTAYKELTKLVQSAEYRGMSDTEKVDAVQAGYTYANTAAKKRVGKFAAEDWTEKAVNTVRTTGIAAWRYAELYSRKGDIESLKDAAGETIANSKGLLIMQMIYNTPDITEEQRKALFKDFNVGKTIIGWNKALVNEKLEKMRKQAG